MSLDPTLFDTVYSFSACAATSSPVHQFVEASARVHADAPHVENQ